MREIELGDKQDQNTMPRNQTYSNDDMKYVC